MEFHSAKEIKTNTKAIWEKLTEDNDVVITNNGKPCALMIWDS